MLTGSSVAVRLADALLAPALLHAQRRREGGVVLLYHRVSPMPDPAYPPLSPGEFERHLEVLADAYSFVPLDDLVQRVRERKSVSGLCAVTFDDGFGDFIDHAYPVLARHEVPVTHFLVSQCLRTGRPTWNYRLNRLLSSVGEPPSGGWKQWLGRLDIPAREDWLVEHEERVAPRPEPRMIRPEDLSMVDSRLVSWGSHSRTHAMVGWLDATAMSDELEGSRRDLRGMGAGRVDHFAFPNDCTSAGAIRVVAEAGYSSALTVGQQEVGKTASCHQLPRFDVGGRTSRDLRLETTGSLQSLRRVRRRSRAS